MYASSPSSQRPEAGTVIYSAPECFNDELGGLSAKADVYSLAVILCEMLTRERPWSGLEFPGQIMYQVGCGVSGRRWSQQRGEAMAAGTHR